MLRLAPGFCLTVGRSIGLSLGLSLVVSAAGCKKTSEREAQATTETPKVEKSEPSKRSLFTPYRALLDETSRAELDAGGLLIDFGDADQHKYTRGGWHSGWAKTHQSDGKSADQPKAWGDIDGRRAWLDIIVPDPAPQQIVIRARSQVAGQAITFYSGETDLGHVVLDSTWKVHRVALEAGKLAPGLLRFELRSLKGGGENPRAEIDWLWLANSADAAAEPTLMPRTAPMTIAGKARRALISPGERTYSFYVQAPEGGSLVVDLGAAEQATFEIAAVNDGAEREVLLTQEVKASWKEAVVPLSKFAGKPLKLELTTSDHKGAVGWGEPEIMIESAKAEAPVESGAPAKNVVFILMDTARADHYGPLGGPDRQGHTPVYDQVAASGTLFTAAYNNENWTKPSVATSLTGLYPTTHDTKKDSSELPGDVEMLSEHLKADGFATAGFVANGYVSNKFGFEQGWDKFTNFIRENRDSKSEKVYKEALDWLKQHNETKASQPFFLYVQIIDPHVVYEVEEKYWAPYYEGQYKGPLGPTISAEDQIALGNKKLDPSEDNIKWLKALYQGEIAYHDEQLGLFLKELDALGVRDNTLLVITNDHGEELGERGRYGHGHQVHEELLRAPLVMSYPPMLAAGRRIGEVVEHVDLAPTILEILGREPLANADGVSFLPLAQGKSFQRPGYAISEFLDTWRVLRIGHYRLMVSAGLSTEFYNLASDPKEEKDLKDAEPIALRLCQLHLGEGLAVLDKKSRLTGIGGSRQFQAGTADIDPETRRQLEALGYFGGSDKGDGAEDGQKTDPPAKTGE